MKKIIWIVLLLWWVLFSWYQYKIRNSNANPIDSRAVVFDSGSTISDADLKQYEIENKASQIQSQKDEEQMKKQIVEPIAEWTFNKLDAIHRAWWWVTIKKSTEDVFIEFADNFTVANGPDLFVILSNGKTVSEIKNGTTIQLGALTQKKWKQVYRVSNAEWESTKWSISIWCRAFDVYFSIAVLK